MKQRTTWTKDQLDFLQQHYASATAEELQTEFGHPLCSVIKKAEQLGLRRPWKWTNDELELLNQLVRKGLSDQEIAVELGRPVTTVAARRRKSGTLLKNRWTEAEDNLLKRHYETMPNESLVALLPGRDPNAIGKRAANWVSPNWKCGRNRWSSCYNGSIRPAPCRNCWHYFQARRDGRSSVVRSNWG